MSGTGLSKWRFSRLKAVPEFLSSILVVLELDKN